MAVTKFEKSLIETEALRSRVLPEFKPLFNHLIELAKDAHKRGSFKQSGRDLAHARKLLKHGEVKAKR